MSSDGDGCGCKTVLAGLLGIAAVVLVIAVPPAGITIIGMSVGLFLARIIYYLLTGEPPPGREHLSPEDQSDQEPEKDTQNPGPKGPVYCPNCATRNRDRSNRCDECGHDLGPYCPHCGIQNSARQTVCMSCGRDLP